MSLYPHSRSSLLPLLMKLEWLLLGLVAIAQILVTIVHATPILLIINGLGLLLFAAMRLKMPQSQEGKLIYTLTEFGLIFFLGFIGNIPLIAILFIVLVIRNCLLLQGYSRVIVTGLAFFGCILVQTYRLFHQKLLFKVPIERLGSVWVGFLLVFGLVILFLHLLVDVALKERQGQQQLEVANARLRQYALRVEELATDQERNRIARDIHDSLGHSLTVFSIHLEAALRLLHSDPEKAETLLFEIKQLNAKTLQDVRQSVAALRSDPLQKQSLSTAIANLVTEFHRSTNILPTCVIQLEHPLTNELNVAVYRIVQESLTNICKYAAATQVKISIVRSASNLHLTVQDNGNGFEFSHNTTGFGLQGMQERTLALGGHFEIVTTLNQGCLISAMFPQ